MISLQQYAGIAVSVDTETYEAHLDETLVFANKSIRMWDDMRRFVDDQNAAPARPAIYSVLRGVMKRENSAAIAAAHLRHDITIIPPGMFTGARKEYFRTAGHYHPVKPGTSTAFPEVYAVLSGRGYFLLQYPAKDADDVLTEVYVAEAGPGEKVVVPPGFGHISINASQEPLVLANWIGDTFSYLYAPYQRFRGGAYWLVEGAIAHTIEFEKNTRYREVAALAKLRPREVPEFGLLRRTPFYALAQNSNTLAFLTSPEDFPALLTIEHCFHRI